MKMTNRANDTLEANPAFLLLDSDRNPLFANEEALRVLSSTRENGERDRDPLRAAKRLLVPLIPAGNLPAAGFSSAFFAGKLSYVCRIFPLSRLDSKDWMILLTLTASGNALPDQIDVANRYSLTGRESELLGHLMYGLTNKEIGERMSISPNTVKAFLKLMMTKMGVATRAAVVGRAFEATAPSPSKPVPASKQSRNC
jgi:DNA-binding CsgD family transcriptional regulator